MQPAFLSVAGSFWYAITSVIIQIAFWLRFFYCGYLVLLFCQSLQGNSSITVNSSKEGQLSFGHARRTRSLQSSNVMKRIYFSHVSTNNSRYKLVVTAIENVSNAEKLQLFEIIC